LVGSDLFFVLSGFLIGGILLDAKSSPTFFGTFYIRRAFRILPIYALLSAAPLLVAFASPRWRDTACMAFGAPLPWYTSVFFVQNIWFAIRVNWGRIYLGATWSLAVEEQFYLTLPLLVRKVSTRALLILSLITIVSAPLIRPISARFVGHYAPYTLVTSRADALMYGVLVAILVRKTGTSNVLGRHTRALLTTFAALLGTMLLVFIKRGWNQESVAMNTVGYSAIAAFYCCLLLLAIAPVDNPFRVLLRSKPLTKLGTVAYCVYLIHSPLLDGIYYLFERRTPRLLTFADFAPWSLSLALTFVVASISWRYFEQPLIAVGHSFRYKALSVAGVDIESKWTELKCDNRVEITEPPQ